MNDKPEHKRITGTELREDIEKIAEAYERGKREGSGILGSVMRAEGYKEGIESLQEAVKDKAEILYRIRVLEDYWTRHDAVKVADIDAVAKRLKGDL